MSEYTNMVVKVNGQLEFQNQSVDVDHPDTATDVTTIPGGDVGIKKGVMRCMVSLTNAQPYNKAGFDYYAALRDGSEFSLEVYQEGSTKRLSGQFRVRSAKQGQPGPNDSPTMDLTFQNARSPAPIFE